MKLNLLKTVYDFRRWPLYTGYQKLCDQFGYDAMSYFTMLLQLLLFYGIIFIAISSLWLFYSITDTSFLNDTIGNAYVFSSRVAYSEFRGIIHMCTITLTVIFARFVGYQRKLYVSEYQKQTIIEDITVAIMNIPRHVTDNEIDALIAPHARMSKYLRVVQPRCLGARRKLYQTQKAYDDYVSDLRLQGVKSPKVARRAQKKESQEDLLGDDELIALTPGDDNTPDAMEQSIIAPQKPSVWIKFTQLFKVNRDHYYYQTKLQALQAKIQKQQVKFADAPDAAICTFETVRDTESVIKYINSFRSLEPNHPLAQAKLHAVHAPAPDDIYLENLEYQPVRQALRYCLTFLVVFLTSMVLFAVVCLFRVLANNQSSNNKKNFLESQFAYYGLFLLTYVADWVMRPILYWAQGFERHLSYTQREQFWILKLYVYQIFNKFTVFFSRNVVGDKINPTTFFDIFGFDTAWRKTFNHGGQDAIFYIWIVVLGYNCLDLLLFVFYLCFFNLIASNRRDKIRAMKCLPLRFASKYVYMLVVFTFVLTFCHVQPCLAGLIMLYFPLQSFVCRLILLRMSAQTIRTHILTKHVENYLYFAAFFSAFWLCYSYVQLEDGLVWFLAVFPYVGWLVMVAKMGFFDSIVIKADAKFKQIIGKTNQMFQREKIYTESSTCESGDWYEIMRPLVFDSEIDASNA